MTGVQTCALPISRKSRLEEVDYINKTNFLVNETDSQIISPGAGSASNPNTEQYLIAYRQKFPSAKFPPFVRKKWNNVVKIEAKYPRQKMN